MTAVPALSTSHRPSHMPTTMRSQLSCHVRNIKLLDAVPGPSNKVGDKGAKSMGTSSEMMYIFIGHAPHGGMHNLVICCPCRLCSTDIKLSPVRVPPHAGTHDPGLARGCCDGAPGRRCHAASQRVR